MIEDPKELWFYFSVYFIKVYLIYNVFIFAEQQGDSVTYIYIYTHILLHILFHYGLFRILNTVPCAIQ